jgi:hypothetical protein
MATCAVRDDDSVSRPTTCQCSVSLAHVCDIILSTHCGDPDSAKQQAMAILTSKPAYKDVDLDAPPLHPDSDAYMSCPSARRMASGLDEFWDILPRLPTHEFLMHWLAFLFLRPVPLYVCVHDSLGVVCPKLLDRVLDIQRSVSLILQTGMWNCTPRDTIAWDMIQAVLGYGV